MQNQTHTDIRYLKGVGEKRAGLFHRLGVDSIDALLHFYPRAYEDWSKVVSIASAPFGEPCCVKAIVSRMPSKHLIRKGLTLYKAEVTDSVSLMQITFFNNPYAAEKLKEGEEYLFFGRVGGQLGRREMASPLVEPAQTGERIRPIYSQTQGLSSRVIESCVAHALALRKDELNDPLPDTLRQEYSLCHLRFAMENIHFPADEEALLHARRRLVFEELLTLQLGLLRLKARTRTQTALQAVQDYSEAFFALLPFSPTGAQRRAISECLQDMRSATPMSRLLQGDVGSGKTAVAAALIHTAAKNGLQCAMMAPTGILAEQHYHTLEGFLGPAGIHCALLTGATRTAEKKEMKALLTSGEIDLVVGTHALLQKDVVFRRLGLVITDEQHRFGVGQRAALADKGGNPHLLVMSATPIPRTLALMIYGDLDISILDELPPGRQKIKTYAVGSRLHQRVYAYIRKHLDQGLQAYIVCPLVEEGETELTAAQEYAQKLQNGPFRGYRLGLLHGRMKPKEKEDTMRRFAANDIQLLVSTTVVEVGVDVPNAVVIVIENAERFGLSQLHQLRGRVGRGRHPSSCILISDAENGQAKQRLQTMCETTDGFQIADADLKMRGPGDFFGARQHGLPALKIANMVTDMEALKQAQEAARGILQADPGLAKAENAGLRQAVERLFQTVGETGLN